MPKQTRTPEAAATSTPAPQAEREVLRNLIDQLHEAGVEKAKIELPMIAVMGDTSSGKSSLLSSIGGVAFPASDELTTRCPIRLHMQYGTEKFRGCVSVTWDTVTQGKDGTAQGISFEPIACDSPAEVTDAMVQAQMAVLERGKLAASTNGVASDVVEVRLVGPSYDNLTLVDLPGIVRSVGDGESEQIIHDIEALLSKHLKNTRCIVLAVIPANVDVHNNQVLRMCAEVDPDQTRTVPVVTKCDLVGHGAERGVEKLLRGQHREFHHGYFGVKCRDQKQLSEQVSLERGLLLEKQFFDSREPFASLQKEPEFEQRFGTQALRRYLATMQADLIRTELPKILVEMEQNLAKAKDALHALGTPVPEDDTDRVMAFERIATQFATAVKNLARDPCSGALTDATWPAMVQRSIVKFTQSLQTLRPWARLESAARSPDGQFIRWDWTYVQMEKLRLLKRNEPAKIDTDNSTPCSGPDGSMVQAKVSGLWKTGVLLLLEEGNAYVRLVETDEAVVVANSVSALLPLEPDAKLHEVVSNALTEDLSILLSPTTFNCVFRTFLSNEVEPVLRRLVEDAFLGVHVPALLAVKSGSAAEEARYPRLAAELEAVKAQVLERVCEETRTKVAEQLCYESEVPFTTNEQLVQRVHELRLLALQQEVLQSICEPINEQAVLGGHSVRSFTFDRVVELVRAAEEAHRSKRVNAAFRKQADMSLAEFRVRELHIALQAYWTTCAGRICDSFPLLLRTMGRRVGKVVLEVMKQVPRETICQAFCEPEATTGRRKRLQTQTKVLEKSIDRIKAECHFST